MKKWILGIESTADVFSLGLCTTNGEEILNFSSKYEPETGGIRPREAAEHHAKVAPSLLGQALKSKGSSPLVGIAFSMGPGLGPSLRVGATVARSLASYLNIPLYPTHHAVAHIEIGKHLAKAEEPLTVLVSGGHTMVTALEKGRYRVYGETLDIALGNLLDMFGREVGYSTPAGPKIEEVAKNTDKFLELPYTVKGPDLSFSGLLTATKRALKSGEDLETLCNSLQEVAFSMLTEVTERILVHTGKKELLVVGGVARNARLRQMLQQIAKEHNAEFSWIKKWNSDNGAQIAFTGHLRYQYGKNIKIEESFVRPTWRLDEVEIPW